MALNANQVAELQKPLDAKHVASREQSGRKLAYIEGWHAISEANRIFGFDGWQRETIEMREVRAPEQVKGQRGTTWRVGFIAKVRITVGNIIREGTGYGSGALPDLGEAYESAIKEAETDAMKRALMTFGNPFGLALYDKSRANVVDEKKAGRSGATDAGGDVNPFDDDDAAIKYTKSCLSIIDSYRSEQEIRDWWNGQAKKRRDLNLGKAQIDIMLGRMKERFEVLRADEAHREAAE